MSRENEVIKSSGNVFADMGLPDAEELLMKTELALEVTHRIKELSLSQQDAAKRLKTTQNRVSRIMNAHLDGISIFRLLEHLRDLGVPVAITVGPPSIAEPASIQLHRAA